MIYMRQDGDTTATEYKTIREAVAAYEKAARDLWRYGQTHTATLSRSPTADPHYLLTLGPRGGIRRERC
jgi:hypothetical protein